MRFFEVDSAVDAIMSAALLAQGRASEQNKQGKLSMTGFLQMLANSDVVIDYDGFKNIFDRTPALQNVIAQFNKDTITFKGDSDDEDAGFEPPSGEMPDDERVAKMADRAMRTREFTEADDMPPEGPEATVGNYTSTHLFMCGGAVETVNKHGDKPGMEKLVRLFDMMYKMEQAVMEGQEATPEVIELAERVLKETMDTAKEIGIEDEVGEYQGDHLAAIKTGDPKPGYGMVEESQYNISEDAERIIRVRNIQWDADDPADIADLPRNVDLKINVPFNADEDDIDDIVADELTDRFGFTHDGFETQFAEDKLPPHLAKMFGKDGKQVDTRTDVMKQMRDIVANKQAMKVKFGDGDQMIDMYTASVLTQIYDKVNDNSKEAIIQRIGTKEKFAKLMPKLFGMLGEGKHSKNPAQQAAIAIAKKKAAEAATGVPPEYGRMIVGKGPKLVKKKIGEAWQAVKEMKELYAVYDTANGNRVVATYSSAKDAISGVKSAELPPMRIPDSKTLRIQQTRKQMMIGDKVETKSDMLRKAKKRARVELGMSERSLTKAEKGKMRSYEKKIDKADFIERYGKKEGPGIYYGTITKMAKKNA